MAEPIGRPSIYSPELAATICKRLSEGESLRTICNDEGMPWATTVHDWVLQDRGADAEGKGGFYEQYARARELQAENMFEELLEIADYGRNDWMTKRFGDEEIEVENREVTTRSRLRLDTRKWYLSKVLPKKFGEKLDVTSDGKAIKGNTIVLKDFSAQPNETGGQQ